MRTAAVLSTCDSSDGCWAVLYVLGDVYPTIQLLTLTTLVLAGSSECCEPCGRWPCPAVCERRHFIPVIGCRSLQELTDGKKYFCWLIISVPDTFMFRIVFRKEKRATGSGSAGEKISLWPGTEVSATSVVSLNPRKEENNYSSTVSENCSC